MIQETAHRVLARNPDPVVQWLLLHDVLQKEVGNSETRHARRLLFTSRWVHQLASEQWEDGSWGRLHSRDTAAGQRIPTTEAGVERAVRLGLPADHPILVRATNYLTHLLRGTIIPRDRPERNDRWPTGITLCAAATLALVRPDLPELDQVWALWVEIARRSLSSGAYDPVAESQAHRELTGATVAESYLVLNNRYTLTLLGARPETLPDELEMALVQWVWTNPQGVRYFGEPLSTPPRLSKGGPFERWLRSLELLAAFPSLRAVGEEAFEWLWARRMPAGLWDFGRRSESPALPLSESWRRPGARAIDWTTRVLHLMRRVKGP